ncbi:MAG TPA: hypothetical protein VND40_02445 [Nitrososphaerales archaeon]|nr:hypothetical protein [Nitrososphaerales archaeon]
MQVNAGKLQILTVAAMLVLISGGIGAYAQNQFSPGSGTPAAAAPGASDAQGNNQTSSLFTSTDTVTTFSTSTSTTSTISATYTTVSANHTLCQAPSTGKAGRLVLPITAAGPSTGSVSFTNGKGCYASITTVGGVFSVQVLLRYATPVTQYNVVLVANGTSYTLGNMVTGPEGSGQTQNQVLLKTGTYVVSIQIFDTSSNPGHSTLVLQTGQGTIVSPPFPVANSSQQPVQGGQGQSRDHK